MEFWNLGNTSVLEAEGNNEERGAIIRYKLGNPPPFSTPIYNVLVLDTDKCRWDVTRSPQAPYIINTVFHLMK